MRYAPANTYRWVQKKERKKEKEKQDPYEKQKKAKTHLIGVWCLDFGQIYLSEWCSTVLCDSRLNALFAHFFFFFLFLSFFFFFQASE